jgi:pyruvate dehydrogenase E1 component alpha subunit
VTQAIAPAGAPPSTPDSIPTADLPKVYQKMVMARVIDERCLTMQRQGRIGFYVPLQGQEAAQIGCAWALEAGDWIFPAYRELGVALVRGVPVGRLLDQFIGNAGDPGKGRQMPNHYGYRDYNFVTASSPVGTQISQAVGASMAIQRRKDPIVTITFFGDGTTSSNDFHAGLNFAGVFRTPTIFFCQNNQWAISLPREQQTHSETLAEKAGAYGFPGVVVDGTDAQAVYAAVAQARRRARAGEGPTLIEAQVYRLGPHSTSDDPKRYRSDAELQLWKSKDPLARMKHDLMTAHGWTEEADARVWEEARQQLGDAIKIAEATPPVEPLTLFDDVFQTSPSSLMAQRAEFAQLLKEGVLKP